MLLVPLLASWALLAQPSSPQAQVVVPSAPAQVVAAAPIVDYAPPATPIAPTALTGTWTGSLDGAAFSMQLKERAGAVTGILTLQQGPTTVVKLVRGTARWSADGVSVVLTEVGANTPLRIEVLGTGAGLTGAADEGGRTVAFRARRQS
ncbi:MAG: hypothetical protein ACI8PZ_001837 [Myxococcota bacterium]|jgi:hypothetical protein